MTLCYYYNIVLLPSGATLPNVALEMHAAKQTNPAAAQHADYRPTCTASFRMREQHEKPTTTPRPMIQQQTDRRCGRGVNAAATVGPRTETIGHGVCHFQELNLTRLGIARLGKDSAGSAYASGTRTSTSTCTRAGQRGDLMLCTAPSIRPMMCYMQRLHSFSTKDEFEYEYLNETTKSSQCY